MKKRRTKPAISVVIPAYNEEKYLPKCLASLKKQRGNIPFEIIVCDNNSQDNTRQIASSWKDVIVVTEPVKGCYKAIQKGITRAKGDIIALIDADTRVSDFWIQHIYTRMSQNNTVVCVGGPFTFYDGPSFHNTFLTSIAGIASKLQLWQPVGSNMAVKKSAYLRIQNTIRHTNLQWDRHLVNNIRRVGTVLFDLKMTVQTSSRRWQAWDIIVAESCKRITNAIWLNLFNKPLFHSFQDYR